MGKRKEAEDCSSVHSGISFRHRTERSLSLNMKKRVVIDAGHGGTRDPGAVYFGRQEKDDALRLALAVGSLLEDRGFEVVYTRVSDVYDTPYEKAQMGNNAEADYFVSIHRNAAGVPENASGIMTLVYADEGFRGILAREINEELKKTGFQDLGVVERPGLVVLRRTQMPAVLVEAGFIDNPEDNRMFDEKFEEIAEAIAAGIEKAAARDEREKPPVYYMVQTGAYRMWALAEQQLIQLQSQGYPAYLVYEDGYYKVRVGAFRNLDYAAALEAELRDHGYATMIVRDYSTEDKKKMESSM